MQNFSNTEIIGTYDGHDVYRTVVTGSVTSSSSLVSVSLPIGNTATRVLKLTGSVGVVPFGYYVSSTEFVRGFIGGSRTAVTVQSYNYSGTIYAQVEYTID